MLKKLFSRKNSYTTALKKDIAEINAISKQYEETRKQLVKNVETKVTSKGGCKKDTPQSRCQRKM